MSSPPNDPAAEPSSGSRPSPAHPSEPTPDDMEPWRRRIDEIDRTVLQLLNERAHCANVIGSIKKTLGMPVYVPSREEEVLRNVCDSNEGPLPREAVRRLFERVIDETRSLERRTYQTPPPERGDTSPE